MISFVPQMIDTHSHIYDEAFKDDFDDVVSRAKEAGVRKIVMPGIDSSSFEAMCRAADSLPCFAYPALGLHPTEVRENWREELRFVEEHLGDRPWAAIGEIGMDLYWSREFEDQQMEVFC